MTEAPHHLSRSIPCNPPARLGHSVGSVASRAATVALWAVVALLAVAPAQAQTVTIEKIPGEGSFDAGERATAKFRIRARGSDAPWRGPNEHAGITVGVEFDYEGRDTEYWSNSNYTKSPGNKVSRFEVVLSRTPGHEAAGSVLGNRFWDLTEHDMGNADLHLIGPVIVRLYDPPGGRTYSLGSDTQICLVINESDGTAGEPCSSRLRSLRPPERLTASFDGLPASHDGQTAFSFRIQFSEDIDATVDGMRDHALNVSGGTVTGAARVNKRDDLWSFTITPSGDAKVEIILAGGALGWRGTPGARPARSSGSPAPSTPPARGWAPPEAPPTSERPCGTPGRLSGGGGNGVTSTASEPLPGLHPLPEGALCIAVVLGRLDDDAYPALVGLPDEIPNIGGGRLLRRDGPGVPGRNHHGMLEKAGNSLIRQAAAVGSNDRVDRQWDDTTPSAS